MLKLDLIQAVAFAGIVLFMGYGIRGAIKPLAQYNVPALIAAVCIRLVFRVRGRDYDPAVMSGGF